MKTQILVALIVFISACSSVKTRKEVAAEAKVVAAEEESGPIDDQAIDDGLAELGVDPEQTPEAEVGASEPERPKKRSKSKRGK